MEPLLRGLEKEFYYDNIEVHQAPRWKRVQHKSLAARILGALFKLLVLSFAVFVLLYTTGIGSFISRAASDINTMPSDEWLPCFPATTTSFQRSFKFSNLKDFSLHNLIREDSARLTIRGHSIRILQSSDQKEDIVVDFSFNTSDLVLQEYFEFTQGEDSLVLKFPKSPIPPEVSSERQCIETETIIYVRTGLTLNHFDLESWAMSVIIPSELDFDVDTSNIKILAGALIAHPMFKSRETYINETSGSVKGQFPLYDVLDIVTVAGSVIIDVLPQEADPKAERPALLSAQLQTGAVVIQYPPEGVKIPTREYRVDIGSQAGSVSGRYIHGMKTSLKATTGSVRAELIPFAADNYASELTTETTTGSQHIKVLSPYLSDKKALRRLAANHVSLFGSVQIAYPSEWEGIVEAVSKMGRVAVQGEGLTIIKEGHTVIGKFIEAEKGSGDYSALCKTDMGSVNFEVGSAA
jgi:hypothetical protein